MRGASSAGGIGAQVRALLRAVRDHLWTAFDVARGATWGGEPRLADLLAGGRRQGMNESPDCFYTVGFVHLRAGLRYRVELPASDAFYAVVSLHSSGRQSLHELVAEPEEGGIPATTVLLSERAETGEDEGPVDGSSPSTPAVDSSGFDGLTQIMVRLYFDHRHEPGSLPMPRVVRQAPAPAARVRRGLLPASLIAGARFLLWRVKPLLVIRWLLRSSAERLPRNRFLGFADVRSLWRGGDKFVQRIGVESFKYLFCLYDLGPGEALEVSYPEPHGRYFAFSLTDPGLQGLDHRRGVGYLASHEIEVASPGVEGRGGGAVLRVDPDRPAGPRGLRPARRHGLLAFREILPADPELRPQARLVPSGDTSPDRATEAQGASESRERVTA